MKHDDRWLTPRCRDARTMWVIRVTIGDDDWLQETDAGSTDAAIREVCERFEGRHDPSRGATFALLNLQRASWHTLERRRRASGQLGADGPATRRRDDRARSGHVSADRGPRTAGRATARRDGHPARANTGRSALEPGRAQSTVGSSGPTSRTMSGTKWQTVLGVEAGELPFEGGDDAGRQADPGGRALRLRRAERQATVRVGQVPRPRSREGGRWCAGAATAVGYAAARSSRG